MGLAGRDRRPKYPPKPFPERVGEELRLLGKDLSADRIPDVLTFVFPVLTGPLPRAALSVCLSFQWSISLWVALRRGGPCLPRDAI